MDLSDIAGARLANQRLVGSPSDRAEDVVRALGAVQAQDYAGAKWALGLRLDGHTDADVERAFDEGRILRTHVLRPTWHFVAPRDIRWMLALTAPRVRAAMAYYDRQLDITDGLCRRSQAVLAKALAGGNHLTREELGKALAGAGIVAQGQRLGNLMMRAELDAVVCSGPRRGKQFTYALLDERTPASPSLDRDEALAELASRYFIARGPALVPDFAWWSGLTVNDAQRAVTLAGARLRAVTVDGRTYWRGARARAATAPAALIHLLPSFD
ncbi:MAG TPA: winged helix DNA-binding domain-containing protein, partial [Polyangia bacterium]